MHPRPSLFLIGAPKAGTTALATYLADHPNVVMSRPKEPMFWCTDLSSGAHELRPGSLKEYLDLFRVDSSDGTTITHLGEASTKYLRSHVAIPRIVDFNPEAKFIAIVRNPIEVVQAFHMEQVYQGQEPDGDFMTAWRDQDRREAEYDGKLRAGRSTEELLYRQVAAFPEQLRRLEGAVAPERRLVIVFDHFRSDPAAVWRRVLDFLDLPDDGRADFPRVNAAHEQRFPRLSARLLHPPRPLQPVLRTARRRFIDRPNPVITRLKAAMNVARERPSLSDVDRAELGAYFRPQIAELAELLEIDLHHWHGDTP